MRNETLRVRVSETLRQRLEAIAQARDLDLSDIVREACNDYLASKSGTILAEHGSGYTTLRSEEHSGADARPKRRRSA